MTLKAWITNPKMEYQRLSTPYSYGGGQLATHRNPLTCFKRFFFLDTDHLARTQMRDLLTRELKPEVRDRYLRSLLGYKQLSPPDILFFLRSGKFEGQNETLLADRLEPLSFIYEALGSGRPENCSVKDLKTRGTMASKLGNNALLKLLRDTELDFGPQTAFVARRLHCDVYIPNALDLIGQKGKVANKELKRMLLELALDNSLSHHNLFSAADGAAIIKSQANTIISAMKRVGCDMGIHEDDARTSLTLYGRLLREVGRLTQLISTGAVESWLKEENPHIVK